MEKYRKYQKDCVFVHPAKHKPREEQLYRMSSSGVADMYVRVVHDMYEGKEIAVRCVAGVTVKMETGLHQGSGVSLSYLQ